MFLCNHHPQGAHYLSLLKLQLLKQSINTLRTGDADLRFYITTVQVG